MDTNHEPVMRLVTSSPFVLTRLVPPTTQAGRFESSVHTNQYIRI